MKEQSTDDLLESLREGLFRETSASQQRRQEAVKYLSRLQENDITIDDCCLGILSNVIKPLFSSSKHSAVTSTGRKKLVPDSVSNLRFSRGFFDDEKASKQWKNSWTSSVLTWVLSRYPTLPPTTRKKTFESHFHLLVPPILNMMDDHSPADKISGFRLLHLLCQAVISCASDILHRTALWEVFRDALQPNLALLPSLTPETESLQTISESYPAYIALVNATYQSSFTGKPLLPLQTTPFYTPPPQIILLTHLLRHGIQSGITTTFPDHPHLTIALLHQTPPIINAMGIYTVPFLPSLLPLLRGILSNPFGLSTPALTNEALCVTETLVRNCAKRIRERWWVECLRTVVGGWLAVSDHLSSGEVDGQKVMRNEDGDTDDENDGEKVMDIKKRMQRIVASLAELVGDEFDMAKERLVREERGLQELFGGVTAV